MLDMCCGRLGWAKAFLARGWKCVGVDLVAPPSIPAGFTFYRLDLLSISRVQGWMTGWDFDFICASTPCDEFSCFGMKMFQPNPKYPETAIRIFNHARAICEASGLPYVMENVRPAQQFVGHAAAHCGPFFFWGNAVPPLMPQGITKSKWKPKSGRPGNWSDTFMGTKSVRKVTTATIPMEISACVAEYAERLCGVSA